jgi:hypothetical protein
LGSAAAARLAASLASELLGFVLGDVEDVDAFAGVGELDRDGCRLVFDDVFS